MKRPEIIADMPFRINPNKSLPVLCIIKDADKFPTRLNDIEIEIEDEKGIKQSEIIALFDNESESNTEAKKTL